MQRINSYIMIFVIEKLILLLKFLKIKIDHVIFLSIV